MLGVLSGGTDCPHNTTVCFFWRWLFNTIIRLPSPNRSGSSAFSCGTYCCRSKPGVSSDFFNIICTYWFAVEALLVEDWPSADLVAWALLLSISMSAVFLVIACGVPRKVLTSCVRTKFYSPCSLYSNATWNTSPSAQLFCCYILLVCKWYGVVCDCFAFHRQHSSVISQDWNCLPKIECIYSGSPKKQNLCLSIAVATVGAVVSVRARVSCHLEKWSVISSSVYRFPQYSSALGPLGRLPLSAYFPVVCYLPTWPSDKLRRFSLSCHSGSLSFELEPCFHTCTPACTISFLLNHYIPGGWQIQRSTVLYSACNLYSSGLPIRPLKSKQLNSWQ